MALSLHQKKRIINCLKLIAYIKNMPEFDADHYTLDKNRLDILEYEKELNIFLKVPKGAEYYVYSKDVKNCKFVIKSDNNWFTYRMQNNMYIWDVPCDVTFTPNEISKHLKILSDLISKFEKTYVIEMDKLSAEDIIESSLPVDSFNSSNEKQLLLENEMYELISGNQVLHELSLGTEGNSKFIQSRICNDAEWRKLDTSLTWYDIQSPSSHKFRIVKKDYIKLIGD